SLPFNGDGSMRRAVTADTHGGRIKLTDKARKQIAERLGLDYKKNPKGLDDPRIRERFTQEIDGERVALSAWLHRPEAEMKDAYEKDALKRDEKLKSVIINPKVVNEEEDSIQVKSIVENRCVSCHTGTGVGAGAQYPLNDWDEISSYTKPEKKGKSLS